MSLTTSTFSCGVPLCQQRATPHGLTPQRSALTRPCAASCSQESGVKAVDVSKTLKASLGLGAALLLSASSACALPQSQLASNKPSAAFELSAVHARPAVADLSLEALTEAARGKAEDFTKEVEKNLPASAPNASVKGAAKDFGAMAKDTARSATKEPTPGGTTENSPVSMMVPSRPAPAMQLAGVTDEKAREGITEAAKFPIKLDTDAGFKRNVQQTKEYTENLIDKAKNSRPAGLSPGNDDTEIGKRGHIGDMGREITKQ
ncbi:hypothetical protein WJX73_005640 [Symbiochloris irregularis]|uniref:Uncharacterized protein n=1 Tax=Symbiochloris irregularis TaxID=706552 RepID=A0AAW1NMZ1_9CHLO